ncbi:DUF6497 family protein [Vannielia litorea]|uniref:Uncharacterized protein n=1 Tax=Vannielia litorea TaxID=1217970 RepID=A0A1N6ECX3_9RHOB|nr:DUF6497 family protein [Vannielia litorea]SIN80737.1 hypothetical protein SAMN05444002_0594 [Vannielia litorea]
MIFSCQYRLIDRRCPTDASARSGRFGRLFKAHGLLPDVRVRLFRTGEGRPRCGTVIALILSIATPACAADLPEGWAVFHDAIVERHIGETEGDEERWLIMRYLAPAIARDGGTLVYDDVSEAMDVLCNGPALETARSHESPIDQIVIALMDRVVERGQPDPEATQFIASYQVTETGCEWQ